MDSKTHLAFKKIPEDILGFEVLKSFTSSENVFCNLSTFKINVYLVCQASAYIKLYDTLNNGYNKYDPYQIYKLGQYKAVNYPVIPSVNFNSFVKTHPEFKLLSTYPSVQLLSNKTSSSPKKEKEEDTTSIFKSDELSKTITKTIEMITDNYTGYVDNRDAGYCIRAWLVSRGILEPIVLKNQNRYWPTSQYKPYFVFSSTGKQYKVPVETINMLKKMYIEDNKDGKIFNLGKQV